LAISAKGDYTVIAVADIAEDGSIYLVHLLRERMPGAKLVTAIQTSYDAYRPFLVFVEDVAFQRLVIEQCRMKRIPVKGVRPEGDKLSRSVMLQCRMEAQQVYFPEGAKWVDDAVSELIEFPNGAHDDIVDALSYLAIEGEKLMRCPPQWKLPEIPVSEEERKKREEEEARLRYIAMVNQGLF
jgi:predicted phage terminase large subunit-like protein